MPRVKIVTLATLYEATGKFEHHLELEEDTTILDAIKRLAQKYPELARQVFTNNEISDNIRILLNGRPIENKQAKTTKIKNNDTITLIPPAGGGTLIKHTPQNNHTNQHKPHQQTPRHTSTARYQQHLSRRRNTNFN